MEQFFDKFLDKNNSPLIYRCKKIKYTHPDFLFIFSSLLVNRFLSFSYPPNTQMNISKENLWS